MRSTHWKKSSRRGGFTLLETSLGISVTLALSMVMFAMLQQHVIFTGWLQKQSFLTTEAPQIGNLVGRIFGAADHYFVYANRDSAIGGAAPILSGGQAVRLFYDSASGNTTEIWITVDTVAATGKRALRCYSSPNGVTQSWTICDGLTAASFDCSSGVLGVQLTGPNQEEITYYGGSR
ncbi:hypothetical protein [Roseimicrobium gellanilyticum]|nr:hypothetical protein [Roseimicrobium gellanilyticum]